MVASQTILPVSVYLLSSTFVGGVSSRTVASTVMPPNFTCAFVVPAGAYQFRFTEELVSPGWSVRYSTALPLSAAGAWSVFAAAAAERPVSSVCSVSSSGTVSSASDMSASVPSVSTAFCAALPFFAASASASVSAASASGVTVSSVWTFSSARADTGAPCAQSMAAASVMAAPLCHFLLIGFFPPFFGYKISKVTIQDKY